MSVAYFTGEVEPCEMSVAYFTGEVELCEMSVAYFTGENETQYFEFLDCAEHVLPVEGEKNDFRRMGFIPVIEIP